MADLPYPYPVFQNEEPNAAFHTFHTRYCDVCGCAYGTYHRQRKFCPTCHPIAVEARQRRAAAAQYKRKMAAKAAAASASTG